MKGWNFKYLEDCGSPAELPAEMNALKTQQYRWTKGAAECTRKNLGKMITSKKFKLSTKLNAIFHLLNSSIFICIVLTSVLSVPVLFIKHHNAEWQWIYNTAGVFLLGVVFLMVFYFISYWKSSSDSQSSVLNFIWKFPVFLSISMGLSLHNGMAAFEGLIGKKSPFIRTPKFNILAKKDNWKNNKYVSRRIRPITYVEMLLAVYFSIGLYLSYLYNDYGLFPFLLMLTFGYSYVSLLSVKHAMT